MQAHQGFFITFEGGEGCGKSTQARLLYDNLLARSISALLTQEPGGTPLGGQVRPLLKARRGFAINPLAELFLFSACRAQLTADVIRPALAAGQVVICDRYSDSTTVYQGHARGLDPEIIAQANAASTGGLVPGLTVLLDVQPGTGLQRKEKIEEDRFDAEDLDFHEKVRGGYLHLANSSPGRWLVLDASLPVNDLSQAILRAVLERLGAVGTA
jgi:dTMP kinase